ncbi:DUF397 domain-containing protein [Streptomyces flaveolus]|uniref:DUF397 domain-containing protein n=1 Tax=Streptomyces flaveolus TaxID=67297 RepID=A0ABV1VLN5_9ACTN
MAPGFPGVVPVRDSKNPDGPVLVVGRAAWAAFTGTRFKGFGPTGGNSQGTTG